MRSDLFKKSALLGLLLLPALSIAADKPIPPAKPETPVVAAADKEPIYGYQLMTEQERATFRTQMQAATTDEERQQIRLQHREQMLERAKAQGVTLQDMPMMNGQGMGKGMGMGMGGGTGSGSSSGSGSGSSSSGSSSGQGSSGSNSGGGSGNSGGGSGNSGGGK